MGPHLGSAEQGNEDHEDGVGDGAVERLEEDRVEEAVMRLVASLVHDRRDLVLLSRGNWWWQVRCVDESNFVLGILASELASGTAKTQVRNTLRLSYGSEK